MQGGRKVGLEDKARFFKAPGSRPPIRNALASIEGGSDQIIPSRPLKVFSYQPISIGNKGTATRAAKRGRPQGPDRLQPYENIINLTSM